MMMKKIEAAVKVLACLLAVALAAALITCAPLVLAGTDQFVQGSADARGGTITFNLSGAYYTPNTGRATSINFSGYIGNSTLVWVRDNAWASNTTINPGVTTLEFVPGAECASWIAMWDNTSRVLVFRSNTAFPSPLTFFSVANFGGFYFSVYGALAYGFIMLIPITAYLKTKSATVFSLILLFMSAAGFALSVELRPFAILGIGFAIGIMVYRIFWRND